MGRALVLYQFGLAVSLVITTLAAVIAWRNRGERGATPLAVLLAAAAVWTASDLVASLSAGSPLAVVGHKLGLSSVVVLVASLLVFALEYTGRGEYVRRETVAALAVEPIAVVALVWTAEYHGLFWRSIEPDASSVDGVAASLGPVYHFHTVYSYVLLALAVILIVVYALRSRYLYQRQIAAIVVAALVPWAANAVSLWMDARYNLTTMAFTVTGVAFTWAVVREDFLDITPIATEVVLETIETAVFVVDDDGRIVDINQRARDLLDVGEGTVVGEPARDALANLPNAAGVYEALTDERSAGTREFQSGDRYLRMEASPLVERRDELVGHVFLVVDLTEQRRRERELERRNEQLDRFTGVVSHDLRNPLNVAQGRLELARRECDSEHLDVVERSHDRMEAMIGDLLTLSRQNEEYSTEPVELADAARSAWEFVDTKDASLVVETDDATVEADRDRLLQLFENLFGNAVDHGGGDVTVTVTTLDDGGFAVVDDGPGFESANPEEVFEDGYTTSDQGTGFGLSIVAEIARTHGWSVAARDATDGGARIEVRTAEPAQKTSTVD